MLSLLSPTTPDSTRKGSFALVDRTPQKPRANRSPITPAEIPVRPLPVASTPLKPVKWQPQQGLMEGLDGRACLALDEDGITASYRELVSTTESAQRSGDAWAS
jgi:hypothetical protein